MTGGVSPLDHGFLYGDGVYETVRCYEGKPFLWDAHYRRLRQSARLTRLSLPVFSDPLQSAVCRLVRRARQPDASVRLTLTRGPGPLGLDPTMCSTPTLRLHLHPVRAIAQWQREGVSAAIVSVQHIPSETLDPRIKSISLLPMVLAKAEAKRRGALEGILLNGQGELTEGTTSNLFWVRNGMLHTPALVCGLLPGITRSHVLRLARRSSIPIREGRYKSENLWKADEIFITNSSYEIMPVRTFHWGRRIKRCPAPGNVTSFLQARYRRS